MKEVWQPSAEDRLDGQEAYIRYLAGVSLLHDPESELASSLLQGMVNGDDYEPAIARAECMMLKGLRGVILSSNPPELRSPIVNAEKNYDQALPYIRQIVNDTCDHQADRLDNINPAIRVMRPMPVAERSLYKYFCHGRLGKIATTGLMDDFMPSPIFREALEGRTLSHPKC